MAKYTIDLPEKTEKFIREQFEKDNKLHKEYKVGKSINTFEQYLVLFLQDYIEEIEDSE